MLDDLGHSAVEPHSGGQAIELNASGLRIDLLIIDYSMPGMNGAELVGAVRERTPGLPVILATGRSETRLSVWPFDQAEMIAARTAASSRLTSFGNEVIRLFEARSIQGDSRSGRLVLIMAEVGDDFASPDQCRHAALNRRDRDSFGICEIVAADSHQPRHCPTEHAPNCSHQFSRRGGGVSPIPRRPGGCLGCLSFAERAGALRPLLYRCVTAAPRR